MNAFAKGTAYILSAQFFLGGTVRLSPWPFKEAHQMVRETNSKTAPLLYPLIPFKDVTWFNRWVGSWFLVTGACLAHPRTRGSPAALGLLLFWTSLLAYSQSKIGMSPALPLCNAVLGSAAWWIENNKLPRSP